MKSCALILGLSCVLTGCFSTVLETVIDVPLAVGELAIEGAGEIAVTTITTTVDVAGAAVRAVVAESGETAQMTAGAAPWLAHPRLGYLGIATELAAKATSGAEPGE